MTKILVVSPDRATVAGGSQLRSGQILEAAERIAGGGVKRLAFPGLRHLPGVGAAAAVSGLFSAPRSILGAWQFGITAPARLAMLATFLERSGPSCDPDLVFWEPHTLPLAFAGQLLRRLWPRARLIAFPHNIESVVPRTSSTENTPRQKCARFQTELTTLRKADLVAGISRLDTQIMSVFGLNAIYFPYRPTLTRMDWLEQIRMRRRPGPRRIFLILGSAQNLPTRLGMEAQLRMVDLVRQIAPELEIVLAGRKVSALYKVSDEKVRVVESPSDDVLADLIVESRALWVQQAPTTGALIRVAEALCAGLPVIGNSFAMGEYLSSIGAFTHDETPAGFTSALLSLLAAPQSLTSLQPAPSDLETFLGATG
ncbi:hypothetical protein [Mesorhizobium sp. 10J20-29]